MIDNFQIIVLSSLLPSRLPAVAIAASRAGALGVIDLAYTGTVEAAQQAMMGLAHYTDRACGLKFDSAASMMIEAVALAKPRPKQISTVILTCQHKENLGQLIPILRQQGLTVLVEVTNVDQALFVQQLGVEGLIAKGHEAGGWVGEETTFILLQRLISRCEAPVWAYGGIGLHTAAACYVAGAAGVVLDNQLALTRESHFPENVKTAIAGMDGSETVCLGTGVDHLFRAYKHVSSEALQKLNEVEHALVEDDRPQQERMQNWHEVVDNCVGWGDPQDTIWPLSQDAAFAKPLADKYHTVGGVLKAMHEALEMHIQAAHRLRPLDANTPFAQEHNIRYPIVQGPMTRVSDRAQFALHVAEGGGLPFLALALMRAKAVETLLQETKQLLEDRPWGVGILGFVPPELREEQLAVIRNFAPAYAIIAGGRPDQASALEKAGIQTYLHVPSPSLLHLFLQDGARRFIFEGRECGGHVGPRSSFVLWNLMVDLLLAELPTGEAKNCYVLFAGGIHDRLSAAMVATLAAPLVERGVRIGVLMGTAYLFTEEIVATGSLLPNFQELARLSDGTITLESGPGHATRCLPTDFVNRFKQEKLRLRQMGKSTHELRAALEALNVGRLRVAAKGTRRHPLYSQDPKAPKYLAVSEEDQKRDGMYMIGQVAALRDQTYTIADLHYEVAVEGSRLFENFKELESLPPEKPGTKPAQIAIIGMACIFPGATNLQTYWENILDQVDAITEVPTTRWDWQRYFDPDRQARDSIYSRWGGFIDDIPFNPLDYGMPPNSISSIEPLQLLMLETVRAGLSDAGYLKRPFRRDRTAVIIGAGGGLGDLGYLYGFRSYLPHFFDAEADDVITSLTDTLPEWTEDSFPGILLNVIAGRIANRFDLGGPNFTVDAACASSLAALDVAIKELEDHKADLAIVGAGDTVQSPFAFLAFSKTQALSPTGRCRPFDADADGIAISEGLAVVVLKRLKEAERDGDRIYAVIQGVGASSDGRDKGLTAPRAEGQVRALERAYTKAGFPIDTVGLIEAHGTGTRLGDRTEIESLNRFIKDARSAGPTCAIGSVKSMIGHTKSTAGLAGLIKVALALYYKVLPPTLVERPTPDIRLSHSPVYVNNKTQLWFKKAGNDPRRGGVSAFGFGGTNFHAVIEEYQGNYLPLRSVRQTWPAELLIWRGESREDLLQQVKSFAEWLSELSIKDDNNDNNDRPSLRDIAYSLYFNTQRRAKTNSPDSSKNLALSVVATSLQDLQQKMAEAQAKLASEEDQIYDPRGIYFNQYPLWPAGKIAFLYPGQGAQYLNMGRDLALYIPEILARLEEGDQILQDAGTAHKLPQLLSTYIFPPPTYTDEEAQANQQALTATRIAQPALGVIELAFTDFIKRLGLAPDMVAGHSYGELVALHVAGVINRVDLLTLSEARGRFMAEAAGTKAGTMAAVYANRDLVAKFIEGQDELTLANVNSPRQTVISGPKGAIEQMVARLQQAKGFQTQIQTRILPVACAFHSPLVEAARIKLADMLENVPLCGPAIEVFSNTTALPYPQDPETIRKILSEHLIRPVEFQEEIENMYAAGVRIFVEMGPKRILTNLVNQILDGKPYTAVSLDQPGLSGIIGLQKALGKLIADGLSLQLEPLFESRDITGLDFLDFNRSYENPNQISPSPTMWLINGGRAKPWRNEQDRLTETKVTPLKVQLADKVTANQTNITSSDTSFQAENIEMTKMEPPTKSDPAPFPVNSDLSSAQAGQVSQANHEISQVMNQHHQLMSHFLKTHKQIMLTYLGHTTAIPKPDDVVNGPVARPDSTLIQTHQVNSPTAPKPAPLETGQPAGSIFNQAAHPDSPASFKEITPDQKPANTPEVATQPEALTQTLLTLISDRTGYPAEMIDLDVDLEADLGIDSIKRVEILGAFRQHHPDLNAILSAQGMDKIQTYKTVREIIDWIDWINTHNTQQHSRQEDDTLTVQPGLKMSSPPINSTIDTIQRFTVAPTEVPLNGSDTSMLKLSRDRVVLIFDDGQGIGPMVGQTLLAQGHKVVRLVSNQADGMNTSSAVYPLDLTDLEAIGATLNQIRETHGPIGNVIHLSLLDKRPNFETIDLNRWQAHLRYGLVSLFVLMRELYDDLSMSAQMPEGACFLVATNMGGAFALDTADHTRSFFPGWGGVAGLLKTLGHELPDLRIKAIDLDVLDVLDLDLNRDLSGLTQAIIQELRINDGLIEVGYKGLARHNLQMFNTPLPQNSFNPSEIPFEINTESIILVIGGARGITAEIAQELAIRYQPTLILVGRSPLPGPEETPLELKTAGLTSPQAIKQTIMATWPHTEQKSSIEPSKPSLAEIEGAYQRLLRTREMRANIKTMQEAGAKVHYYQADVRDEVTFGQLIDNLYETYNRLDGVIHGAGIIEDKYLKEKQLLSFERVISTKVDSAFILARKLRADQLKFLVFFSSVSARFGNKGQGDYAAANEILNKLAIYLNQQWPTRVVSINWGPWQGAGMVSAELSQEFVRRGVSLISPAIGRKRFIEELTWGTKSSVEILICGEDVKRLQSSRVARL